MGAAQNKNLAAAAAELLLKKKTKWITKKYTVGRRDK